MKKPPPRTSRPPIVMLPTVGPTVKEMMRYLNNHRSSRNDDGKVSGDLIALASTILVPDDSDCVPEVRWARGGFEDMIHRQMFYGGNMSQQMIPTPVVYDHESIFTQAIDPSKTLIITLPANVVDYAALHLDEFIQASKISSVELREEES